MLIVCWFRARDMGRMAEISVDTSWSVPILRARAEEALQLTVRTMKYKRREIQETDSLEKLGLVDGATVFVNSPTLVSSAPIIRPPPPRAAGFTEEVIARRVAQLQELGFPRDDCERALRAAQFNTDRAVDYLIRGAPIPEPLVIAPIVPEVHVKAAVVPPLRMMGESAVPTF
jgi:hypothetical protein